MSALHNKCLTVLFVGMLICPSVGPDCNVLTTITWNLLQIFNVLEFNSRIHCDDCCDPLNFRSKFPFILYHIYSMDLHNISYSYS